MTGWQKAVIGADASILAAIAAIDSTRFRIAIVVDDEGRLAGTVTDGDVRRGLLRQVPVDRSVFAIMNANPRTARLGESQASIRARTKKDLLRQIPVLDDRGCVIGLEYLEEDPSQHQPRDNHVVLMAGGLGTRLRPMTETMPKPLLPVGGKPILETILETLAGQRFRNFFIAVNYKADMVREHFGDGSRWGVTIRYLNEDERLGTAGALSLIDDVPSQPLLIMNGDLLIKLNFDHLLDYHRDHGSDATMCVREYDLQVPFGVVNLDRHKLVSIDEKPLHRFFINAGIYVLNPAVIGRLQRGTAIDMTGLFESLLKDGAKVSAFPLREFWLDIGRIGDYNAANGHFPELFENEQRD